MSKFNTVTKASGEKEAFSRDKLYHSLSRSGADDRVINSIIDDLENEFQEGVSTRKIYRKAFDKLRSFSAPKAARYKLKQGIMELGPSGYPFEKYIGEIFKYQGYKVQIDVLMKGHCVTHEIDVVAQKDHELLLIECKFHNRPGTICDVKVPLYIHSRFLDVEKAGLHVPGDGEKTYAGWVVTNTHFSIDAIEYSNCSGLHLLGWDYPKKGNLKDLIDASGLHPLTCLTTLSGFEKSILLDQKLVLCKDLLKNEDYLKSLNLTPQRHQAVLRELKELQD